MGKQFPDVPWWWAEVYQARVEDLLNDDDAIKVGEPPRSKKKAVAAGSLAERRARLRSAKNADNSKDFSGDAPETRSLFPDKPEHDNARMGIYLPGVGPGEYMPPPPHDEPLQAFNQSGAIL